MEYQIVGRPADGPADAPVPPASSHGARRTADIEVVLAWTYQQQRVTWVEMRAGGGGGGGDGFAMKVDGGGYARVVLHPDAEAVHDAVLRLPEFRRELVIRWAQMGGRPPTYADRRPWCGPEIVGQRRDGRPRIRIRYDRRRHPVECAVRYRDFPEDFTAARRLYTEWWIGLVTLVPALIDLVSWRVVGPDAPEAPWAK